MILLALLLAAVALLHGAVRSLLPRGGWLTPLEAHLAAATLQVTGWIALSFALAFAGIFQLAVVLGIATLVIVLLLALSIRSGRWAVLPADAWLTGRLRPAEIALAAVLILQLGTLLLLAAWRVPVAYDELSYHLGMALHFAQDGAFVWYPGESFYANHFARGAHLLMSVLVMATEDIRAATTVQWLLLPLLCGGVYTVVRRFGGERWLALAAANLVPSIPVVAYQATIGYVDLFSNGWIAAGLLAVLSHRAGRDLSAARVAWVLCCGGLAVSGKFNAATLALVLGLAMLVVWGPGLVLSRWRPFALGFLFAASVALPWPTYNWLAHGSPFYPIMLTTTREGLENWEYPLSGARAISEVPPYNTWPHWQRYATSWTTFDWESPKRFGLFGLGVGEAPTPELADPTFGYSGDAAMGGFGLGWLLVGLPSLLLLAGLSLWDRARLGIPVLVLATFPVVGLLVTVSSWWPRLALFAPVLGLAGAFVLLAWLLRGGRRSLAIGATGLVILVYTADLYFVHSYNRDWERLRRFADSGLPPTPIHWQDHFYPGQPQYIAIRFLVERAGPRATVSFWTPGDPIFTGFFTDARGTIRQYLFPTVWPDPMRYTPLEMHAMMRREGVSHLLLSTSTPSGDWNRALEELRVLLREDNAQLLLDNGVYQVWGLSPSG